MHSTNENRMLLSALTYARKFNFAVFPLNWIENGKCSCKGKNCSAGKHPLTSKGVKDATKDERQIAEWWRRWPKANIGIACGDISGILVLDIDVKPTIDGRKTIEELENTYETLPHTAMQLSGSGGIHYFFKTHKDIKNGVGFLPGLDIRNNGGYIIGAPSSHISGKEYAWESNHQIANTTIREAPQWLIQTIISKSGSNSDRKPVSHYVEMLQGIGEGARNHSTASLSGYLLRKNIDPAIAFELIKIWNETRCNPPLTEEEVTTTFISIFKREMERRKGGGKNGTFELNRTL